MVNIPDGQIGDYRVETFEVSQKAADFENMRAAIGSSSRYIIAGTYKRLMRGHTVVMSDTPAEMGDHSYFIRKARGDVLINGLGLGMVVSELLKKKDVKSITVIEISPEVIQLVGSAFEKEKRVTIIEADALTYKPPKGKKFDAVWHDIWDNICPNNLKDMKTLHRKYGRRSSWQDSWCRSQCEYQKRQDRYSYWR